MDEDVDWGSLESLWARVEDAIPEARRGAMVAAAQAGGGAARKSSAKTAMKDRYRDVYNAPAIDGSTADFESANLNRTQNAREWKKSRKMKRQQLAATRAGMDTDTDIESRHNNNGKLESRHNTMNSNAERKKKKQ